MGKDLTLGMKKKFGKKLYTLVDYSGDYNRLWKKGEILKSQGKKFKIIEGKIPEFKQVHKLFVLQD